MADKREKKVEIFQDSLSYIEEKEILKEAVRNSLENQTLYLESDEITLLPNPQKAGNVVISKKRSFEAAMDYAKKGQKVCVLNFASATNPGGGVTRGSSAQEECLCRCSTLFPCLSTDTMMEEFYQPHRDAHNPLYNNDCLYTPEVIVFKSDIALPERMDEGDFYKVDVLTCAAPNLRAVPSNEMNPSAGTKAANIDEESLYKLHTKRIERIFQAAISNRAEVLILGAFGCGAFCNPPKLVAKAFKAIQDKYAGYFDTVEYAVFCRGYEIENYDAFCEMI